MRSSKTRSRNKNNRSNNNNNNRSGVNIVNRVFDSSGPDGKVRGTPQQIIEKYTQLARDAQLSNDRVAAENFQQHAEHYLRLLGEAQREIDARREQEMAQQAQRDRQQQNHNNNNQNQQNNQNPNTGSHHSSGKGDQPDVSAPRSEQPQSEQPAPQPSPEQQRPPRQRTPRDPKPRPEAQASDSKPEPQATDRARDDVIDTSSEGDSGLVETPESKPARPPRRTTSKPRAKVVQSGDGTPEAAE